MHFFPHVRACVAHDQFVQFMAAVPGYRAETADDKEYTTVHAPQLRPEIRSGPYGKNIARDLKLCFFALFCNRMCHTCMRAAAYPKGSNGF